jgi:hypothetical protein
LGAQQQKISRQGGLCHSIGGSSCASISSVLIELENKRTVSSIEATQVKIERETSSLPLPLPLPLPPLSPEPDIDIKINERIATLEKNNKLFKGRYSNSPNNDLFNPSLSLTFYFVRRLSGIFIPVFFFLPIIKNQTFLYFYKYRISKFCSKFFEFHQFLINMIRFIMLKNE